MKKNSYYKVTLSFFTLCAIVLNAADFINQVKWVTSVTDGYFTDLANWTDVTAIPTNKEQSATIELSQNGDYTIRFPEGVTTNYAAFYVVGFNNQSKSITIDTTQGALYQAPSTYQSDWQGFGF
jgi:hypothetical protein